MKLILILLLALSCFGLQACEKEEETRTVEWYLQPENKVAWDAKLEECRNNPGELNSTPNCVNARKAFDRNFMLGGGPSQPTKEPTYGFSKK